MKESFVVLPKELFETEYFKQTRSFTFPKMDPVTGGNEVYSVFGVFETGSRWGGSMDINFTQGEF